MVQARELQKHNIEKRGFDDTIFNFLVDSDGAVYTGRGWDKQGDHTKGYNEKSICIGMIGTFRTVAPPKQQLLAAQKLIKEGVNSKNLAAGYRLYGQRQLSPGDSPGFKLYQIIQSWDHWSEVLQT